MSGRIFGLASSLKLNEPVNATRFWWVKRWLDAWERQGSARCERRLGRFGANSGGARRLRCAFPRPVVRPYRMHVWTSPGGCQQRRAESTESARCAAEALSGC